MSAAGVAEPIVILDAAVDRWPPPGPRISYYGSTARAADEGRTFTVQLLVTPGTTFSDTARP